MRPAPLALLVLAVLSSACDLSAGLDIETPEHEAAVVVRSVLEAGGAVRVRVTTSRDPYGPQPEAGAIVYTPSRMDGRVTVVGPDGEEVLETRPQTCYRVNQSTCNAETGQTVRTRAEPYECGVYQGRAPAEPGQTYTLRVELPGLETAEATVTVPHPPEVVASEQASSPRRRFRFSLADPPGRGDRYALTIFREVDQSRRSVCRVGGTRDTVVALTTPAAYRSRFDTTDPVLVAAARGAAAIPFMTFPDDAFDGQTRVFDIEAALDGEREFDTGAVRIQVSSISPVLYDAFQILNFNVDTNPFAEPQNLPLNVNSGFGRVGAVAVTEVRVERSP